MIIYPEALLAKCIDNDYYKVSLTKDKIYKVLSMDTTARLIEIVDDSGEEYFFSADLFLILPDEAMRRLQKK